MWGIKIRRWDQWLRRGKVKNSKHLNVKRLSTYESLFDHDSNGVYSLDTEGRFIALNPTIEHITGFQSQDLIGRFFASIVAPTDLAKTQNYVSRVLMGDSCHFETTIRNPSEQPVVVRVINFPIIENGSIRGVFGIAEDITRNRRTQQLLHEQNGILKQIASGSNLQSVLDALTLSVERQSEGAICSILVTDDTGQHLRHGSSQLLPRAYIQAIDNIPVSEGTGSCGTAAARQQTVIVTDIATDSLWTSYRGVALAHGLQACWSHPILSTNRATLGTFAMYYRSTRTPSPHELSLLETYAYLAALTIERNDSQSSIHRMAYYDDLTGFPNRRWLNERLIETLTSKVKDGRSVAVIYLDLDRFKAINDSMGHATGDLLLKRVSEKLQNIVGEQGIVARTGGDEFLVALPNMSSLADVANEVQRVLEVTREPIVVNEQTFRVTSSIGVSLYPQHGKDIESLLKGADVAMYQAKNQGGNQYHWYSSDTSHGTYEDLQFSRDLFEALERDEFSLHYQPRYSISERRIVGVEALLRWNHPEHGSVPPLRFIPLLEETGDIVRVGEWVLRTACRQALTWQRSGYSDLRVSVNISARQFQSGDLFQSVTDILEETELNPKSLEIEITESTLIQNNAVMAAGLKQLKKLGVSISIDDFGTGYSSLSYLLQFRVDTLKIDQSFIRNVVDDVDSAVISSSVISLAHNLKISVVAEGVETLEQFTFLANKKCDEIQGYWLSRPLPPKQMEELLSEHFSHMRSR